MSIFFQRIQDMAGTFTSEEKRKVSSCYKKWSGILFWAVLVLLVVGAVVMRLYLLNAPFDRDGYDEGVYWQSLLAMRGGQSLYQPIFYSQPPFFLLSLFPGFLLFGGTLWAARFSIAVLSLLGFFGIYMLGKALNGRLGALIAILLLLVNPIYLAESQTLQAEIPSLAFTLLAMGFALRWWQEPTGKRGICWSSLMGVTLALSIGSKLISVSTLVPIALIVCARIWKIYHQQPERCKQSWLPILTGISLAILTMVVLILPFIGVFGNFWAGVISFHEVAARVMGGHIGGNYHFIRAVIPTVLITTAVYGTITAFLRGDWRVIPLLIWLLAAFFLLLRQFPLFYHHMVTLIPPLISLAVLGVAAPASYKRLFSLEPLAHLSLIRFAIVLPLLSMLLIVRVAVPGFQQEMGRYASDEARIASTNFAMQKDLSAVGTLRQSIKPDQWVITDAQFLAALADRRVPPWLVDTSGVRIYTNYLDLTTLERAAEDPHVHAVLFYTHRLLISEVAGFHAWVARHFHLVRTFGVDEYGSPQELWVR